MSDACELPTTECPFFIYEGADFSRTLTWLQTKNGPAVDLTGYLAELWIKPEDPDGEAFVVSSDGTSAPGTSITIDGTNGKVFILITRAAIPDLKLTLGAAARFDLTDTADVKTAQFRTTFNYKTKFEE